MSKKKTFYITYIISTIVIVGLIISMIMSKNAVYQILDSVLIATYAVLLALVIKQHMSYNAKEKEREQAQEQKAEADINDNTTILDNEDLLKEETMNMVNIIHAMGFKSHMLIMVGENGQVISSLGGTRTDLTTAMMMNKEVKEMAAMVTMASGIVNALNDNNNNG